MTRSFLEITNEFPGYDDLVEPQKQVPLSLRDKLSIFRIIGICCSLAAFQIAKWVKYTLQILLMRKLGVRESIMALITITDPLSRFIVQPYIEILSDNCKLKFGRRRPFILAGGIGIVISFLCFFLMKLDSYMQSGIFVFLLSISLLILNFSLQILRYPSLQIVNDLVPQKQQAIANLISSLTSNTTAFLINLINGFLYNALEHWIFFYSLIAISILITITLIAGKEEPLLIAKDNQNVNQFSSIFSTMKLMPNPILKIAIIYSLCWFSYYPFLLECTDYFGAGQSGGYSGVSYGIFTFSIINLFVLIYSPFHEKIVQKFGMKNLLAVSMCIVTICLALVWLPIPKLAGLMILAPMGVCEMIFNSIPFIIVSMNVPEELVSIYNGVFSTLASFSQILSSFLVFALFGEICRQKVVIMGIGFISAFGAAFMCRYIVLPKSDSAVMEPLAPSSDYYNYN